MFIVDGIKFAVVTFAEAKEALAKKIAADLAADQESLAAEILNNKTAKLNVLQGLGGVEIANSCFPFVVWHYYIMEYESGFVKLFWLFPF